MLININSKKRNINFLKRIDRKNIRVGLAVQSSDVIRLGLKSVGDTIVPSPSFGPVCHKNANGYSYIDKTQPKENRYVCTIWTYPFGNMWTNKVPIDQYRDCYPKVYVEPLEIEMELVSNEEGELFVVSVINDVTKDEQILDAINMFIEVFGKCSIYEQTLIIETKRIRLNWEILPPGERPSAHIIKLLRDKGEETDTFNVERLRTLERYKADIIGEGTNGFFGYYAYVFNQICVLESAFYGNATYIIPKENWETLSQKTKKELFDEKQVLKRIVHNEEWEQSIRQEMKRLENKSLFF